MPVSILSIDNTILLLCILIIAVLISFLKREPEPFKNMIDGGRSFYNKHQRLVRKALEDTSKTITDRVITKMRLSGF